MSEFLQPLYLNNGTSETFQFYFWNDGNRHNLQEDTPDLGPNGYFSREQSGGYDNYGLYLPSAESTSELELYHAAVEQGDNVQYLWFQYNDDAVLTLYHHPLLVFGGGTPVQAWDGRDWVDVNIDNILYAGVMVTAQSGGIVIIGVLDSTEVTGSR
jgi:hypothetical protein